MLLSNFGVAAWRTSRFLSTAAGQYTQTEVHGRVGLVRLNRPPLNPLNDALYDELAAKLEELDRDGGIGCLVLTGNERAFAAGADIKHMAGMNFPTCFKARLLGSHKRIDLLKTPLVGVVRGYALGGGCELAMQCDILFAGESAKFGQPEVKIGTIPGAGGTQRLIRAVGKSRAMQMVLAGEPISARQACDWGLVSEVHPDDKVLDAAMKLAEQIAALSKPVVSLAKIAVNTSYEVGLKAGLDFEERAFQSTFALEDKMEGMGAFTGKRQPNWKHQ